MKRLFSILTILSVMAIATAAFCTKASAEEMKMVGVVTRIEMQADQAIATLKDNKSGQEIPIVVTDQLTLDKFKDHRIVEGDEIRCKYDQQGEKNASKYFRKTAGC